MHGSLLPRGIEAGHALLAHTTVHMAVQVLLRWTVEAPVWRPLRCTVQEWVWRYVMMQWAVHRVADGCMANTVCSPMRGLVCRPVQCTMQAPVRTKVRCTVSIKHTSVNSAVH